MTDESKTKRDTNELVLDWDDAVDSWGHELDDSATAEAAPFPARTEPKPTMAPKAPVSTLPPPSPPIVPAAPAFRAKRPPTAILKSSLPPLPSMLPKSPGKPPSIPPPSISLRPGGPALKNGLPPLPSLPPDARVTSVPPAFPSPKQESRDLSAQARTESGRPRMYKPPSGHEELKRLEAFSNRTLPPPSGDAFPAWLMDEDESESTRIASIPRELMEALGRADAVESDLLGGDARDLSGLLEPQAALAAGDEPTPGSLRLDADEAFSLRSSLVPIPPAASEAPQLEIGTDDAEDSFDADALDEEELEDEPTGMHSLVPEDLTPAPPKVHERALPARPLPPLGLPKPPFKPAFGMQAAGIQIEARSSVHAQNEEPSVLRNLDELAPPEEITSVGANEPLAEPCEVPSSDAAVAAPNAIEAQTSATPAEAQAPDATAAPQAEAPAVLEALRKLRAKRKRVEHLPLAGADVSNKRARIDLLLQLASQCVGLESAGLSLTAAELAEEIGASDQARDLYERSLKEAPDLAGAYQGLGRLLAKSGDLNGYVELLARHANIAVTPQEKARLLATTARLQWLMLRDFPAALRTVGEALKLEPEEKSHLYLAARIETAANVKHADATLARLAESLSDAKFSSLFWVAAGRTLEQHGKLDEAHNAYAGAAQSDPESFEAQLAVTRTSLAKGQLDTAAAAMHAIAEITAGGALKEAARRRAFALAVVAPSHSQGAEVSEQSHDPVFLRTVAESSQEHVELSERLRIAQDWVDASHGTERARALLWLAELEATRGDLGACDRALTNALEGDPTLALVPVVRELLSRKHGAQLQVAPAGDDAFLKAARFVLNPEHLHQEVEALLEARGEHWVPACTETVLLDAALEAGEIERARTTLASEAERGTVEERISSLLALADYARRHEDAPRAQVFLQTASELDARNVLVSRALLRTELTSEQRIKLLRREAESSNGARAAFLLLRAGLAANQVSREKLELLASAYEASPAYAPATWALHQEARKQGDIERLSDLHAREAGRATDPHEAIAHLVRAALVRAGADADAAAAQLTRALDLMPADPVLRELVIRLGDAVPATLRAEAIQSSAERAPNALKRPATLAAAAAFEDANQPARALRLFEAVLRDHPGDPIAELGLERVAKPAGLAAEVEAEKRKQLTESTDSETTRQLLENLFRSEKRPEVQVALARELLEHAPKHAGALRRLEIEAMITGNVEALEQLETRLIVASQGEKDRTARLRFLTLLGQLRTPEPDSEASKKLDKLAFDVGMQASKGLWLGRQLMSAAETLEASEDKRLAREKSTSLLLGSTTDRAEQSTLLVQHSRWLLESAPEEAVALLERNRELSTPLHPTYNEALAEAYARAGKSQLAADLFEECARASQTPGRAARLYYRAGVLHQEQLNAPERARAAFMLTAEANLSFEDVEERLEQLLSGKSDLTGLVALAETRLRAAQQTPEHIECARRLGSLYEKQGETEKARDVLRQGLESAPEDLPALAQLAALLADDASQQRERAEILVRIARLSREPDELCDVFFKLGEIYDEHLPDPKRAEAALRRVLKISPRHKPALERLSSLLQRNGQTDAAAESLERLIYIAESPEQKRDVSFELSRLKEQAGELRDAEDVLERLRKATPTDVLVLRELAEFYRRREAQTALAMHLNRAVNDLRQAILQTPHETKHWEALIEVLLQRGRKDAASVAASGATALGVTDADIRRLASPEGNALGLGAAAFSELLDDLIFPDILPPAVRILFRHGAEAMTRAMPLDLRALAAEKLDRKHPLRAVASEFAKLSGFGDVEVFQTAQLPFAFVPISEAPLQILVGKSILDAATAPELRFLMARACKIAKSQMSLSCRLRPEDISTLLHGLIHAQVPTYRAKGLAPATLEEMGRKVQKHLSRKAREEMLPHVVELAAQTDLDFSRVYTLASGAGSRAALLATGITPAALSALCKLSGSKEPRINAETLADVEEARDLLGFSVSEPHFEARQRAGAERR